MLCETCDSLVTPCWTTISSWCNEKIREKREPLRLRCSPTSARETAFTLLRVTILFLLVIGMTRLVRVPGDGPPSLFWPTNGVIIMFLNSSPSVMDFLLLTVTGMFGLAVAQFGDFARTTAFELAGAKAGEFILASIIMRLIHHVDVPIPEAVKTFRFLAELIFVAGVLASSIGASVGAYVMTSEYPESVYNEHWTDWFMGDLTGNFIVLYIGYLCVANSRQAKLEVFRETLKTRMGFLYVGVTAAACGMVITIYSLKEIPLIEAIPLMLLASPILGNMALCFPQEVTAVVDLVLVLSVVIGTKLGRGPFITVLEGASPSSPSQRTVFICIEATLLISTTLTATLAVAREHRVAQALRIKTANDDRVAFFSHLSHEFRTPLSVIIGFTEDLLKHLDLPRRAYSDLESVLIASTAMSSMVDDLLAFFRLEGNKLTVVPILVQSQEFFGGIFSFSTRLASTKDIRLEMEGRVPAKLVFDPNRVNQVLVNLVANAVKFTQTEGKIVVSAKVISRAEFEATRSPGKAQEHVGAADPKSQLMRLKIANPRQSCGSVNNPGDGATECSSDADRSQPNEHSAPVGEKKDDSGFALGSTAQENDEGVGGGDVGPDPMLVLSVRDTGIGIKPEDFPRLFDRFFRCKNSGAQGTGLGLSIAFNIAKAMGGTLAISSEFGVGSTFTVAIPVKGEEGVSEAQQGRDAAVVEQSRNSKPFSFGRKRGLKQDEDDSSSGDSETGRAKSTQRSADVMDSPTHSEGYPLPLPPRPLSVVRLAALRIARRLGMHSSRAQPEAMNREKPASFPIEKQRPSTLQAKAKKLVTLPKDRREAVNRGRSRRHEGTHESDSSEEKYSCERDDATHETASNGTLGEGGKKGVGVKEAPVPVLPSRKGQGVGGAEAGDGGELFQVHILLAEDSMPNQKLMVRILQRAGHTVETVEDGQAAINFISTGRFDLLILDLGLPIKSGIDVLCELRSHWGETIRNTPVIISSGHVLDSHRNRCLDAGCNAFTEKPFRAKIILDTIQTVMGNHLPRDVTSGDAMVNVSDTFHARIAAGAYDTACTAKNVSASMLPTPTPTSTRVT